MSPFQRSVGSRRSRGETEFAAVTGVNGRGQKSAVMKWTFRWAARTNTRSFFTRRLRGSRTTRTGWLRSWTVLEAGKFPQALGYSWEERPIRMCWSTLEKALPECHTLMVVGNCITVNTLTRKICQLAGSWKTSMATSASYAAWFIFNISLNWSRSGTKNVFHRSAARRLQGKMFTLFMDGPYRRS